MPHGEEGGINVLLVDDSGEVKFWCATPLYLPFQVDKRIYDIRISVFPVHPYAGSGDSRLFRIDPTHGTVTLEMLPRNSAMKETGVAMAWFLGGFIPFFIGLLVAGFFGGAVGGFAGAYLVWFCLRNYLLCPDHSILAFRDLICPLPSRPLQHTSAHRVS